MEGNGREKMKGRRGNAGEKFMKEESECWRERGGKVNVCCVLWNDFGRWDWEERENKQHVWAYVGDW